MTEQEIIVELKKRWPEPHFKDWRVRENWGGSHMAECSVVGVEERFCERVVVATAGTHEKLLAAIRSLPIPSEPSGEDGDRATNEELRIICIENADEVRRLQGELATLRTALLDLLKSCRQFLDDGDLDIECYCADNVANTEPCGYCQIAGILAKHRELIDAGEGNDES